LRVGSLLGRRRRAVRYETAGGDDDARRIAPSFGCCRRWAGRWLEPRASCATLVEHSFVAERAVRELGKGNTTDIDTLETRDTHLACKAALPFFQGVQHHKLQDGCLGRAPAHKSYWRGASLHTAVHGLHAKADATKVILAKAIAARLPRAQKPAGSGTHARALLPSQRYCKHRTHIRRRTLLLHRVA